VLRRFLLTLLASFLIPMAAPSQETILGVLEEVPGNYVGESSWYGVRVIFKKAAGAWWAFPDDCRDEGCLKAIAKEFPSETLWSIAFDGKSLGQIMAKTPREFSFYSQIGLQKVTNSNTVPSVGKPSLDFSGFLVTPVHRPLVAISQPYFKDPDLWKPSTLSPVLLALVRQQFRIKFPKLCRIPKEDELTLKPFPYHNEDVQLAKAYSSRTGWFVVRLHLAGAVECGERESGFELDDPWFTITPEKSSDYLNSGIWLVDAGDYDNDGKSEVLFSISRYDRGGYILYYDDFKKQLSFEFSYH
jgi:hypothetical protein